MQAKQAEVARLLDTACIEVLTGDAVGRYAHLGQSWSLLDLLNPDPEKNLAAQYPTILMNNDQLDNFVANYYPRKRIKDPAYRTEQYWYYPMISAGVPEAGGRQIIGHYDSIARAAKYIDSRAKGKRASKMLGFVGPAGTGKTEIGNLLVTARGILSMTDADYYQFTFEFTNLQDIEGLEPLLYGANSAGQSSALKDVSLGRSPLVLLPESLQKKVTAIARDKFREKVGKKGLKMDPLPWTLQSGKTREVVDAIITHYARKENVAAVTEKDYLRWLTPHVRVVRRPYETMQPPDIIRYLGKHPDMATIYFTENLALSQFYGPKNPLSYSYGLVPSNDGKPVFIDEFFRQTGEFRDSSLDLAQNQTAQNGGAPPEQLNITLYFATNDESIETAMGEGGAKAHLSRTIRLPMRHALEPWHVVKIAINDIGRARFWMRKIDGVPDVMVGDAEKPETTPEATSTDLVPYDPQLVIPDMENGTMVG
ncbi:MAG TPA: hypothetical protein PKC28_14780, partial [Bdellovibrionales bacterium]|nr:hypothetical protein [Bdellovibrionales bacterium]